MTGNRPAPKRACSLLNPRATPLLRLVTAPRSGALPLGYRYGQCGASSAPAIQGVKQSCGGDNVDSQNFALNGFWKPEETGFIPSVSLAYGWSDLEGSTVDEAQTWMVGLQWDKVANTPHTLAVGFGAPCTSSPKTALIPMLPSSLGKPL